ncbi:MAG TPA: penicillin-binding protein activator [Solimonas sp.]|nr:penicillin-binding protein activator [Solimonas sp.]
MRFNLRPSEAWLLALCAVSMLGCASARPQVREVQEPAAESMADAGGALAEAEAAVQQGDTHRARALLAEAARDAQEPMLVARLQVLRARVELLDRRPMEALRVLPPMGTRILLPMQVEELRARALFELADPAGAVRALVERARHLPTPTDVARNNDMIWNGLRAAQLNPRVLARAAGYEPAVTGWVELALLAQDGADSGQLESWRNRYPEHPGGERLGMLVPAPAAVPAFGYTTTRGHLALLLPLSGTFAATSEAVRDGFLSAYFHTGGSQRVAVYDAGGSDDTALAAYQRALNDGAGFVIGPLRKDSVTAIARLGQPPAPILALNYLDDPRLAPFNFFQFGLAPEDEARAAADHATSQGLRRAVALVPSTDWGERVLLAFERRLQERGGQVVASARYAPGSLDFGEPVGGLMRMESAQERHRALTATIGEKSEFEVRRRDDLDFVFFGARPQDARLIWPQFRFNRASDLPVYATSLVWDGGADPELGGVRFCDMPWMLERAGEIGAVRVEAGTLASQKSNPRLFALGYDAYNLVARILAGGLRPEERMPAASGQLLLSNGVVTRGLLCAQIQPDGVKLLGQAP